MIIISEYFLEEDKVQEYKKKNYRVAYGYEDPRIKKGESVGYLLETLYKNTIEQIEYLLATKHKVSLKYENKVYYLDNLSDWKQTYQEGGRTKTTRHYILQVYLDQLQEYREKNKAYKAKEYNEQVRLFITDLPEDLDEFLGTFAKLYEIDYDSNNDTDKLLAYNQIQYYLDNDIPYCRDILGTNPEDEPMFSNIAFMDSDLLDLGYEEESYGEMSIVDDLLYKEVRTC